MLRTNEYLMTRHICRARAFPSPIDQCRHAGPLRLGKVLRTNERFVTRHIFGTLAKTLSVTMRSPEGARRVLRAGECSMTRPICGTRAFPRPLTKHSVS